MMFVVLMITESFDRIAVFDVLMVNNYFGFGELLDRYSPC